MTSKDQVGRQPGGAVWGRTGRGDAHRRR